MVPLVSASVGQPSIDDSLSIILCIAIGLGLPFLILVAVFPSRSLSVLRPALSSSQAAQAFAAAQIEGSASAAELQAKQAEVEKLRRAASRDEG